MQFFHKFTILGTIFFCNFSHKIAEFFSLIFSANFSTNFSTIINNHSKSDFNWKISVRVASPIFCKYQDLSRISFTTFCKFLIQFLTQIFTQFSPKFLQKKIPIFFTQIFVQFSPNFFQKKFQFLHNIFTISFAIFYTNFSKIFSTIFAQFFATFAIFWTSVYDS